MSLPSLVSFITLAINYVNTEWQEFVEFVWNSWKKYLTILVTLERYTNEAFTRGVMVMILRGIVFIPRPGNVLILSKNAGATQILI